MSDFDQMAQKKQNDIDRANKAINLPNDEIIKQIFIESGHPYFKDGENTGKSIAYFAALINKLSIQSDKLQKRMLWLNLLVAALTIVLLLTIPQVNKFAFSFVELAQGRNEQANTNQHHSQNNHEDNNVPKNTHAKSP